MLFCYLDCSYIRATLSALNALFSLKLTFWSAVRLIAGNLYTVHIQGSYVLDYLLVFLDHHIFSSYVRVTLGAVSFSCALVSILQSQHLVPLQDLVGMLCRIPLDCMLCVCVMGVLLLFVVVWFLTPEVLSSVWCVGMLSKWLVSWMLMKRLFCLVCVVVVWLCWLLCGLLWCDVSCCCLVLLSLLL